MHGSLIRHGGDTEDLMPRDTSLVVENPLQLPWDDHALMGLVPKRVEGEFLGNFSKALWMRASMSTSEKE